MTARTKSGKNLEESQSENTVDKIEGVSSSDKAYLNKADRMKKHLDSQPKVKFLIPLTPGEKEGAAQTVILNGYRMDIKKGVMVDVPQQVAELLAESYKIQLEAGKQSLIERSSEVEEALSE